MTEQVRMDISPIPLIDTYKPHPGSEEECLRFEEIQRRLPPLFRRASNDPRATGTVVVIPSLSFDVQELAKIKGVSHYEERLLCLLMLLREPQMHVIYVTSRPIDVSIVDYYLHMLTGIPITHARRRLTMLSCHDGSNLPLTQKVLERPRLLQRIRAAIPDPAAAFLMTFNSTPLERSLTVRLGIPLYGCDPRLAWLGTKSGSREVFREAGVLMPDGFENLRDTQDVACALAQLKQTQRALRRAVIKLNEGFSGIGNALFSYDGAPVGQDLTTWVAAELPNRIRFEAQDETWVRYAEKVARTGAIVEAFIESERDREIRSPSVQVRIDPLGRIDIISTHDQVLGGPSGQIFLGCSFPADEAYRREIQAIGRAVGDVLRRRGVLGRFGIDFISRRQGRGWEHAAVEINLRMGGTTHPYMTLELLTSGRYDSESGLYHTNTGQPRFYFASDNLYHTDYRGLTPDDLMDIVADNNLFFDGASQQGSMFHLTGALSEHGKLGTVCIADSHTSAQGLYRDTVAVLDREARRERTAPNTNRTI